MACVDNFGASNLWLVKHSENFKFVDYMPIQKINKKMRSVVINWMVGVIHSFKNQQETLYRAISIFDKFLEKKIVDSTILQNIGVASIILASKFEEDISEIALANFTGRNLNKHELAEIEMYVADTLNFDLYTPTWFDHIPHDGDEEFYNLINYIVEMSIINYDMIKWKPSELVSAAIKFASDPKGHDNDLCVQEIKKCIENSGPINYSITEKYRRCFMVVSFIHARCELKLFDKLQSGGSSR
jgi:hypothetical protein